MNIKALKMSKSDIMSPFKKGGRGSGEEIPDFGGFCLLLNGNIYIVVFKYDNQ